MHDVLFLNFTSAGKQTTICKYFKFGYTNYLLSGHIVEQDLKSFVEIWFIHQLCKAVSNSLHFA